MPDEIEVLRTIIREIGRLLGQKQMAMEMSAASVDLLDIDEDASADSTEPQLKLLLGED